MLLGMLILSIVLAMVSFLQAVGVLLSLGLLSYLFSPRYGIISRHFKRRHLHEESLERWEKK